MFSAALAALGASRAFAANPPCSPIAVVADAGVRARWPELSGQVREAFEVRTDIDGCARVELALSEGAIAVGVTLPDGRFASRHVSRREDVVPTLEALLLVPEPVAAALGVEAAAPSLPPSEPNQAMPATAIPVVAGQVAVREHDDLETRSPPSPPNRLRIELSLLTEARTGNGQKSVGLGALSLLDVSGWLVGFEGRADRDQWTEGGDAGAALELAALGGRRFRLGDLALDVVAGPAVALDGGGTETTVTPAGTMSSQSPGTVPRGLLGAHLIFGARSPFRIFVGVDGELGLASAPGENPTEAPRLPLWTLGLALGATVGTR